jgi:hypothetical protein
MKKFKVTMTAQMDLSATIELWASNQEDAEDKARYRSFRGKIRWEDTGIEGDTVTAHADTTKEAICPRRKTRG